MSKETILITKIKREKNYLYYCGTSEDGFITIGKSEMARGKKKKKENE